MSGKILPMIVTFGFASLPFIAYGVIMGLIFSRYPQQIPSSYGISLMGSAAGCIAVILFLEIIHGPAISILLAALCGLTATLFSDSFRNKVFAWLFFIFFAAGTILFILKPSFAQHFFQLNWVKQNQEENILFERWNSYSRITVSGNPELKRYPFGWGLSLTYPMAPNVKQLWLKIDADAATVLTNPEGDISKLDYLKYDVVNIAHHLKSNANVFIAGAGGGRDILSALYFKQAKITAVEYNAAIDEAVNRCYGEFTAHLNRHPQVNWKNEDARIFLATHHDFFDLIQISLTDTWAATASGAFALTENHLYTREAWTLFLKRLSPDGILSVSRWYDISVPGEIYRLTALAAETLRALGVKNPEAHIIIVGNHDPTSPANVATLLMSPDPFRIDKIQKIQSLCQEMQFELIYSPGETRSSFIQRILQNQISDSEKKSYPINLQAPTDNKPFFFNMLNPSHLFKPSIESGMNAKNISASKLLFRLLLIVAPLSICVILIPLFMEPLALKNLANSSLYFIAIGFGFMFIELALLQKLIIFLGHPIYALSVILFVILLGGGMGSYYVQNQQNIIKLFAPGLFLSLILLIIFLSQLNQSFEHLVLLLRVFLTIIFLFPISFLIGLPFPLGMSKINENGLPYHALFWSINGAASILSSVLAATISLSSGIDTTLWCGIAFYFFAYLFYKKF